MSRTTLARPLSAGSIIIESSFFYVVKGFMHFLRDVGLWWLSLLKDAINGSPYCVSLF